MPAYILDVRFDTVFLKNGLSLKKVYDTWCEKEENETDHGFWGNWPYYHEEMPLSDEIVEKARKESDMAFVIIGRAAGEDRENKLEEGS